MTGPGAAPEQTPIGPKLLALREKWGWSLREVERRSGGRIKSSHLSQIETGRVREPSLSVLRELAHAFDVTFLQLLSWLDLIDESEGSLPQDELLVLQFVSDLSPEDRRQALSFLRFLVTERRSQPGGRDDTPG